MAISRLLASIEDGQSQQYAVTSPIFFFLWNEIARHDEMDDHHEHLLMRLASLLLLLYVCIGEEMEWNGKAHSV